MSQSITLWGASYSDVPAVLLPKTGGGTARFDDASVTTATASDVASGKIFLASNGTITTGTASGGGASNLVSGTFTVGSLGGKVETVNLSYSGSGYPIAGVIFVSGGMYNNTSTGQTTWYNSTVRYAVGIYAFSKMIATSVPVYQATGNEDRATFVMTYKNSSSAATTYARSGSVDALLYNSSNASGSSTAFVRFKGNGKTLTYYTANGGTSSYGFLPNVTYQYYIIYSS